MIKNLPPMLETWVRCLGQEDPLEKGMATHSSILACRVRWTEETGRLQSMRSQRIRQDWATNTFTFHFQLNRIGRPEWEALKSAKLSSVQFSSVAQSCLTLCDPMNCSTPGLPVHHQLPEFTQTHVQRVGVAIQPSHPLSSPSPASSPSQHQGLFQWVNSLHEVTKILEFQLQHQSFQWTPRSDLF